MTVKPPDEKNHAENPVDEHGDPHAENTHLKPAPQNIAEHNTEGPHGKNRNRHGKAHVIAGAQGVGQGKGGGPNRHAKNRMPQHTVSIF